MPFTKRNLNLNPIADRNLKKRFLSYSAAGHYNGVIVPSLNVREATNKYHLELAIPGYQKKDLKIEVNEDELTIQSHGKNEEHVNKNYWRKEFSNSGFSRSFQLPKNCIPEKINAKYESGILKLSLPKKKQLDRLKKDQK